MYKVGALPFSHPEKQILKLYSIEFSFLLRLVKIGMGQTHNVTHSAHSVHASPFVSPLTYVEIKLLSN